MKPAGLRQIEAAKSDGRWDAAYPSPRNAAVPDDLRAALAKKPRAAEFFETLNGRNRYTILFHIHDAKKPATRARRIAQVMKMLRERRKPSM
jgi:uncharacterized protein YdeI (YjbR/CyaY-like superfamily)